MSEWEHLKAYGYAPGHYMSKCHRCGHVVSDLDKRAITCMPCAEIMHAAAQPAPTQADAPSDERIDALWRAACKRDDLGARDKIRSFARAVLAEGAQADAPTAGRWYVVDRNGVAMVCKDKDDAHDNAAESFVAYPHNAPYTVAQLVPVAQADALDAARQALADEVLEIARTGLHGDGDGVSVPTLLWAESWARRLGSASLAPKGQSNG